MERKGNILKTLKRYLLYAGIEQDKYEKIQTKVPRTNRLLIMLFSGFTMILSIILEISTFSDGGLLSDQTAHRIGLALLFVFSFLTIILAIDIGKLAVLALIELNEKNEALDSANKELANSNAKLEELNFKLAEANEVLKNVSRYDSLTQVQNRNAYEMDYHTVIRRRAKESLGCIFIDVNGLKHVNDTLGHNKGDEMIVFIAKKLKEYFDETLIYRLGGDEFVVFIPDPEMYQISQTVWPMEAELRSNGYNIAAGWKIHQLDHLSMDALVRDAEGHMYQKKAEFYKENAELDRRKTSAGN